MRELDASFNLVMGGRWKVVPKKTVSSHAFVAIPNTKTPRWILSCNGSSLKKAKAIVRPTTFISKLFIQLVFLSIKSKITFWLNCVHVESRCLDDFGLNIYVGAKGIYQKLTVQKTYENEVTYFKLGVTEAARLRIISERKALSCLSETIEGGCFYPKVVSQGGDFVEISSSPEGVTDWATTFGKPHFVPLSILLKNSMEVNQFFVAKGGLHQLGDIIDSTVVNKVEELLYSFSHENMGSMLKCCYSHGDYSPWNILFNQEGDVFVFDWEMGAVRPIGWDLFNFIFHSESLVLCSRIEFCEILHKYNVSVRQYFSLAEVSSEAHAKYLMIYLFQMLETYINQLNDNVERGLEYEPTLVNLIERLADIIVSSQRRGGC